MRSQFGGVPIEQGSRFGGVPVAPPQIPQVQQPVQQPGFGEQLGRGTGLAARAAIQGVAAVPAMVANVGASLSNQIFGTQFPEQQQALGQALTAAGLPEPRTPTERVVGEIGQAVTGVGGLTRLGAQAVPQVAQRLGALARPEAIAAATGAAGAGTARELGAPVPVQIAAGLAAGVGGASFANRANTVKAANAPLFEDISERGIDEVGAFTQLRSDLGNEAANLQQQISGTFKAGQKVKPGLFDIAKDKGAAAFISKPAVSDLSKNIRQQALESVDDAERGVLINAADRLDQFSGQTQISVNDLETLRRSSTQASARGGGVGAAGGSLRRQIDGFLENTPEAISGDKTAVNAWQKAIAKRAEFGRKFEKPKEVAIAITDEPIEVIQQRFLGSGPVSSKRELGRIFEDTVKALPSNQKQSGRFLLKQSIVNQMVRRAAKTVDAEEGISASFMANQVKNLRRENQTVWNKFSDAEKALFNKLEKDLAKEVAGGPINRVAQFMFNFLGRATRSNLELPRTIRPKTVLTVDELVGLTNVKPSNPARGIGGAGIILGTEAGVQ